MECANTSRRRYQIFPEFLFDTTSGESKSHRLRSSELRWWESREHSSLLRYYAMHSGKSTGSKHEFYVELMLSSSVSQNTNCKIPVQNEKHLNRVCDHVPITSRFRSCPLDA